jgi:Cu(I)/Ag(I) efflux system membrane fusion protein
VNVQNPDGKLKPGMFVKAVVKSSVAGGGKIMDAKLVGKWICPMHPEVIKETSGRCNICQMPLVQTEALGYISDDIALADKPLVVPATAVLITGTRAIVYVQVPDTEKPTFEGREIALGPRAGDYYLVRNGLKAGELVVVKGNFKIDSSLQIMAKPSMMTPEGGGGADSQMAVELSALAKHQIQTVIAKSKHIQEVLASENLEDIRNAFTELDMAFKKVDMQLLTGHAHMLWMEYSMRISNDIVEGVGIKTLKEAKSVVGSLTDNTNSLAAKLGLVHATATHSQSSVSDQFRVQLLKVFDAYFATQLALTEDNTLTAGKAVEQLSSSLKAVDMKLLSSDDHDRWMKDSAQLKQILSESTDIDDIKLLRENFYLLSQQLTKIAKHFGSTGKTPFYILHCPMAFDNTGATWLQADDQTLNPYFGQMMLRCGGVEEVIDVKEIWEKKDK